MDKIHIFIHKKKLLVMNKTIVIIHNNLNVKRRITFNNSLIYLVLIIHYCQYIKTLLQCTNN